jgi:parvulin-like peptidyl-prolyl isomerase
LRQILFLTAVLYAQALDRGQVIDRIAVTVGKTVITEGEVLTNLKVAAFLDDKEPDLSGPSKRKAADRLVEQVLLRREVPASGEVRDTSALIADLKKRYASQAEYEAALKHYEITEQDVIDQIANGLESLDASNRRFRAEVQVTEDEIRSRYDTFVKHGQEKNSGTVPSFEASHNQVQELLMDEGVSEALVKWLQQARSQGSIVYREAVFK